MQAVSVSIGGLFHGTNLEATLARNFTDMSITDLLIQARSGGSILAGEFKVAFIYILRGRCFLHFNDHVAQLFNYTVAFVSVRTGARMEVRH